MRWEGGKQRGKARGPGRPEAFRRARLPWRRAAALPAPLTCMAREKNTPASDASFFTLKSMVAPRGSSAVPRPRCHRGRRAPALYSADRCPPRTTPPRRLKRAVCHRRGLPAASQPAGRCRGRRGAPSRSGSVRGSGRPGKRVGPRGRQ